MLPVSSHWRRECGRETRRRYTTLHTVRTVVRTVVPSLNCSPDQERSLSLDSMCAFGPDRAQSQRVRDTDTPEPRARVRLVRLRAVGRGRRSPHSLGRLSSLALGLLFGRTITTARTLVSAPLDKHPNTPHTNKSTDHARSPRNRSSHWGAVAPVRCERPWAKTQQPLRLETEGDTAGWRGSRRGCGAREPLLLGEGLDGRHLFSRATTLLAGAAQGA